MIYLGIETKEKDMVNFGVNLPDKKLYEQIEKQTKKSFGKEEQALIEKICVMDDFDADYFKEKLISFSSVAQGMKNTSSLDYIKAVQYCSYIAIGNSQVSSYSKTFPERVAAKATDGTIRASAHMYHHNKIVQDILEIAMVPMHMLFMQQRFEAVEKLASLMHSSKNERIQMESADKLLTHIKTPEVSKLEIDMGFKANDQLAELNDTLNTLATQQASMISGGLQTAQDVVEAEIVKSQKDE